MKSFKILKKYLKGSYGLVWGSLFLAAISVLAKMAIPFMTGLAIDRLRSGDTEIAVYLIWMAGLLIVGSIFRYFFNLVISILGQRIVKEMRDEIFNTINALPVSYLDTHAHGDTLLRLVNDVENVQNGLISGASSLYEGVVQLFVTIVFMMVLNWALALAVIVLTPLSVFVSKAISSSNSKFFKVQNKTLGQLSSFSLESLSLLETVKAYGLTKGREKDFASVDQENATANYKALFASAIVNPATRLVNNTIYAIVVLLGIFFIIQEPTWLGVSFTVGGLSSFLTYSYQYMTPINEVASVATEMMFASASLERIEELLSSPLDVDDGTSPLGERIETLKAKGINFSYDGSRMIIKNFSLDVYKGHKIALVGPTGCGKTTIINLLMRFYDPQEGSFLMNGTSTLETNKHEMRSHIGMVLQETWLRKGTVAENIAFGKPEATMEEIISAAKKAHADEFIRRLPQGYQTIVSNSSGLSMGEKQLICVARIILIQPEIVLLDEATSNIDLRTELSLAGAFDELMKGKTSLVVAHRLSTIKNADHILVMRDGEIIEQGNFAQLMQKGGFFAELYNSQLA